MNMMQMRITADVSPGTARVTDDFAKTLVNAMMNDLAAHRPPAATPERLGNPVAQARAFERVRKTRGDWILSSTLVTGKRCHYTIYYDQWVADLDPPGRLVSVSTRMRGNGPKMKATHEVVEMFSFSRHCLERLVQRAEIRNAKDLIVLLRNAWVAMTWATVFAYEHLPRDGVSAWTIPVQAPGGVWVCLPVLRNVNDDGGVLVAATALTMDMLARPSALEPLQRLLEGTSDEDVPDRDAFLDALQRSMRATHKGNYQLRRQAKKERPA